MTRITIVLFALCLAAAMAPSVAIACHNPMACKSGSITTTYSQMDNVSSCNPDHTCDDARATCDVARNRCNVLLTGELWLPSLTPPPGGFTVIIFNHGSNKTPPHKAVNECPLINHFVSKNFIVYVPHRRGYKGSTGTYINDQIQRDADAACAAQGGCTPQEAAAFFDQFTMQDMRAERHDVLDAINYLKNTAPFVNPNKIVITGHSLGGIVSIYANETDLGQRATIAIAPDSESWGGSTAMDNDLLNSMASSKSPMFVFEPVNDVSIEAIFRLGFQAGLNGRQYQSALYPPVPYATSGEDAHVCFVLDSVISKRWLKAVDDFLARYGVK